MTDARNYDALPMDWVGDYSGKKALLTPNIEAIFDPHTGARYTYKQIDERANRVATYLVDKLGISKGDRVGLISRNRMECIDLFFACGKIGAILSPLSYRLQKPELRDLMQRETLKTLFIEDVFATLVDDSVLPEQRPTVIQFGDGDNAAAYDAILATEPRDVKVPVAMNDPFLYIHTGGTTAVPKVCIISHRQMMWNAFEALLMCAGSGHSRELVLFPLFHVGGWNVFFCLFMRNSLAIPLRQFDAGQILDMVDQKVINRLGVVEAMLQMLVAHPKFEKTDFSGIELITTAAAPCSNETLQPFWDRGISTNQAYGLTEAGPSNFAFLAREPGLEHVKANSRKVGTPFFCCDYKIVSEEDHNTPLPPGKIGVLCLRSYHNFDGYLNDPERTAKILDQDGWIYSGDLAVCDEEGLVSIVGRADNMFITGGENVSPEEIENALRSHPAVAAAICAGIPDKKWGEIPVAMVVLTPGKYATEADLRTHCKELLASYKVPKTVAIADAIPLTPVGKLDRKALKAYFTNKQAA
ncbi:fatty-acyl-CoA synthase [Paucimonas lemoignei]|uniref:Fatty-acyl-CoA synthase n=1 Tax=Paucimonas lemoignei TaxID=29443 RepID=A0A4R3HWC6_PAULE|nr:AMP-binding protein [Paucimonas lemoignei]TCS37418.1 fatty-acyl-CoA synthase [Paucimonas lemoignei]